MRQLRRRENRECGTLAIMPAYDDPDRALVEATQRGDRAAFTALVERHQKPLYQFAWRLLGDAALAQDATQEALARAWIKRTSFQFRPGARYSTWLFQLARNAAVDLLRKRREVALDDDAADLPHTAEDAAIMAQHKEIGERIASAVAALPEEQRTAVVLAEYHGHSAREIAMVLRCSPRAAESHLYRAKQALRTALADLRA
ncbi:MAG TPA: sigma-70 family RNA polymerase sigma factor [Kiritimatiellia bacterium]|nr:sigma-70 family RNA polymerase sigma factor [Kiritimatiellia bacterium]